MSSLIRFICFPVALAVLLVVNVFQGVFLSMAAVAFNTFDWVAYGEFTWAFKNTWSDVAEKPKR